MTPPIPETGGGLSGFIAHYLWHVYRHFPSSGRGDWLLLFLLLATLVHVLFLPYLWKAVQADMAILRDERVTEQGSLQVVWLALWDGAMMFFLLWFFHTEAGQTFLESRAFGPFGELSEGSAGLYWLALVSTGAAMGVIQGVVHDRIDERNKATGTTVPKPYTRLGVLDAYAGGGVFVALNDKKQAVIEDMVSVISAELAAVIVSLLCYWYWSAASVTLMMCFVAAGVLAEVARMLFVYIQHQRTFG